MRSAEQKKKKKKTSCTAWTNCCCWSLCSNRDSSQCFSAVVENCDVKRINYGSLFLFFFFPIDGARTHPWVCRRPRGFWSESWGACLSVYSVVNSCVFFEICLVVLCCKICTTSCISETTSSLCWFVSMFFFVCLFVSEWLWPLFNVFKTGMLYI